MKTFACTLALGALLTGACASGAGPRTAPEASLAVDADQSGTTAIDADAMSDGGSMGGAEPMGGTTAIDDAMSDGGSMGGAEPMDAESMNDESQEEPDERDVVDLTSDRTADPEAVERCQSLLAEVERRDELGLFDDEEEDDDAELTEEQVERYQLEPGPIDGGVLSPDDRPTFPTMPEALDVTALAGEELWTAVEHCFEAGLVTEEDEDDVGESEFCAELAELTADDIAEWVAEEGDEIVDEEFGWCELTRPDRQ